MVSLPLIGDAMQVEQSELSELVGPALALALPAALSVAGRHAVHSVAFCVLIPSAAAVGRYRRPSCQMRLLDVDGDGQIDLAEFVAIFQGKPHPHPAPCHPHSAHRGLGRRTLV